MDANTKEILRGIGCEVSALLLMAMDLKEAEIIRDNHVEVSYWNGIVKGLREVEMRIETRVNE